MKRARSASSAVAGGDAGRIASDATNDAYGHFDNATILNRGRAESAVGRQVRQFAQNAAQSSGLPPGVVVGAPPMGPVPSTVFFGNGQSGSRPDGALEGTRPRPAGMTYMATKEENTNARQSITRIVTPLESLSTYAPPGKGELIMTRADAPSDAETMMPMNDISRFVTTQAIPSMGMAQFNLCAAQLMSTYASDELKKKARFLFGTLPSAPCIRYTPSKDPRDWTDARLPRGTFDYKNPRTLREMVLEADGQAFDMFFVDGVIEVEEGEDGSATRDTDGYKFRAGSNTWSLDGMTVTSSFDHGLSRKTRVVVGGKVEDVPDYWGNPVPGARLYIVWRAYHVKALAEYSARQQSGRAYSVSLAANAQGHNNGKPLGVHTIYYGPSFKDIHATRIGAGRIVAVDVESVDEEKNPADRWKNYMWQAAFVAIPSGGKLPMSFLYPRGIKPRAAQEFSNYAEEQRMMGYAACVGRVFASGRSTPITVTDPDPDNTWPLLDAMTITKRDRIEVIVSPTDIPTPDVYYYNTDTGAVSSGIPYLEARA